MIVENWLYRIGEYNKVKIFKKFTDTMLSYYDGRNSIDERFNNLEVIDFRICGDEIMLFVD